MSSWTTVTADDTARWIAVPGPGDDKYTRGVLGMITGSRTYPGAAVLGVEAAARTGVGMIRYLGDASEQVLARRPEVVTAPGRVQAWVVGSGTDQDALGDLEGRFADALTSGVPVVADAGALGIVAAERDRLAGRVVITPHARELARTLESVGVETGPGEIASAPERWIRRAAELLGVTILLKGSRTHVVAPESDRGYVVPDGPAWLATAGTGDVLAGIIGAMVATNTHRIEDDADAFAELVASAALLHHEAARIASRGAPFAALDVAEALPDAIRSVLRRRR